MQPNYTTSLIETFATFCVNCERIILQEKGTETLSRFEESAGWYIIRLVNVNWFEISQLSRQYA